MYYMYLLNIYKDLITLDYQLRKIIFVINLYLSIDISVIFLIE